MFNQSSSASSVGTTTTIQIQPLVQMVNDPDSCNQKFQHYNAPALVPEFCAVWVVNSDIQLQ